MRSFPKASAKFRIGAACVGLVIAAWLLAATMTGLEHGKIYLGPTVRWGIIVYCWKNPAGFVAVTAGNLALAATLFFISGAEIVRALKRKRLDDGSGDASLPKFP